MAVELMLSDIPVTSILERLGWQRLPAILDTYLFCCPALDTNLRCLPRDGGYYDQDAVDMKGFRIIESQIIQHTNRESHKQKQIQAMNSMKYKQQGKMAR
jgi:hypothetical protein